ncbi:uncharacterized protein LOC111058102 [Nilaparvata lugens]|uniref:uncharacterized protein LOC111058102 n=1 Tax=Nilaparvata lugens TaxID=108931 RepID=UPI00193D1D59|nr:uncharacterized protein LOC111058102 [Nilaparvata lugens]
MKFFSEIICIICLIHSIKSDCANPKVDTVNVKTVLWSPSDSYRVCWSKSEELLLYARRVAQDLLPKKIPKDLSQTIHYLEIIWEAIQKFSPKLSSSKEILRPAVADVLGGYLQSIALPMVNEGYYAGDVDYAVVKAFYDLFHRVKAYLDTDGRGWHKPCDMKEIPTRVSSFDYHLIPEESDRYACDELHLPDSACQSYETTTFCAKLIRKVAPHLHTPTQCHMETEWFPGFGSVMRILETMHQHGLTPGESRGRDYGIMHNGAIHRHRSGTGFHGFGKAITDIGTGEGSGRFSAYGIVSHIKSLPYVGDIVEYDPILALLGFFIILALLVFCLKNCCKDDEKKKAGLCSSSRTPLLSLYYKCLQTIGMKASSDAENSKSVETVSSLNDNQSRPSATVNSERVMSASMLEGSSSSSIASSAPKRSRKTPSRRRRSTRKERRSIRRDEKSRKDEDKDHFSVRRSIRKR